MSGEISSVKAGTDIPWQDESDWREVQGAIAAICSGLGGKETVILELAGKVQHSYRQLTVASDQLCKLTCTTCREVCCTRATIWYDLTDLLFIYLILGELPARQIFRLPGGVCCNLGESGCGLERWRRPFICSWYLCGVQQAELKDNLELWPLKELIEELKSLRKELFQECVAAVSP